MLGIANSIPREAARTPLVDPLKLRRRLLKLAALA